MVKPSMEAEVSEVIINCDIIYWFLGFYFEALEIESDPESEDTSPGSCSLNHTILYHLFYPKGTIIYMKNEIKHHDRFRKKAADVINS